MVDPAKCTQQFVLNAKKNVKFHSNQMEADQFTVENATVKKDQPEEDIKLQK